MEMEKTEAKMDESDAEMEKAKPTTCRRKSSKRRPNLSWSRPKHKKCAKMEKNEII